MALVLTTILIILSLELRYSLEALPLVGLAILLLQLALLVTTLTQVLLLLLVHLEQTRTTSHTSQFICGNVLHKE